MRLVKQSTRNWQYHLNQNEADILPGLLKKFPFTEIKPAKISKTDEEPAVVEREKLLNESLTQHRKALKKLAANLLDAEKLKKSENGYILTLDSASKEILLQILNDIRIGCWRALGEPEELELQLSGPDSNDLAYRNLMNLTGYFEEALLHAVTGDFPPDHD